MSDDWPTPWQLSCWAGIRSCARGAIWAFAVLLSALCGGFCIKAGLAHFENLVIVLISPNITGDAMHEEIADQVQVQVQVYQYSSVEEATLAASGRLEGVVIPSGLYSGVVGDTVIVVSGDVSVEEAEQVFRRLADR